jgi:hypothetical protein
MFPENIFFLPNFNIRNFNKSLILYNEKSLIKYTQNNSSLVLYKVINNSLILFKDLTSLVLYKVKNYSLILYNHVINSKESSNKGKFSSKQPIYYSNTPNSLLSMKKVEFLYLFKGVEFFYPYCYPIFYQILDIIKTIIVTIIFIFMYTKNILFYSEIHPLFYVIYNNLYVNSDSMNEISYIIDQDINEAHVILDYYIDNYNLSKPPLYENIEYSDNNNNSSFWSLKNIVICVSLISLGVFAAYFLFNHMNDIIEINKQLDFEKNKLTELLNFEQNYSKIISQTLIDKQSVINNLSKSVNEKQIIINNLHHLNSNLEKVLDNNQGYLHQLTEKLIKNEIIIATQKAEIRDIKFIFEDNITF